MARSAILIFLAGIIAGGLVPDIPSTVLMLRENPGLHDVIFLTYLVAIVAVIFALTETK